MKKLVLYSVSIVTLLSGCYSTGDGALTGAGLGAILGSAIGGISGGPRGSDVGTIFGMATGAVAGAAVGSANEMAQQEKYRQYRESRDAQYGRSNYGYGSDNYGYNTGSYANNNYGNGYSQNNSQNNGYFDPTNSGDDRIVMEPSTGSTTAPNNGQATGQQNNGREAYTTVAPRTISVDQLEHAIQGYKIEYNSLIEVRNATFVDGNGDGILHAGETSKVTFEIMNSSDVTLYDVQPTVVETTGNKHVHISPGLRVESIAPHRGVRYTATVFADNRLKNGQIILKIAVVQGNHEITSQIKEFVVTTSKR